MWGESRLFFFQVFFREIPGLTPRFRLGLRPQETLFTEYGRAMISLVNIHLKIRIFVVLLPQNETFTCLHVEPCL